MTEDRYLLALNRAVPIKRWLRIARKAVEQAEAGDPRAREWLSRYLLPSARTLSQIEAKDGSAISGPQIAGDGPATGKGGTRKSEPADLRELIRAVARRPSSDRPAISAEAGN